MQGIIKSKSDLRKSIILSRKQLNNSLKLDFDKRIFNKIITNKEFIHANCVLVYVSTTIEVDTINIIKYSLSINKKVAVPFCLPNTNIIEFYYINSLEDLHVGSYSILEPTPNEKNKYINSISDICIVPGLSFDEKGYRLGYGKGYYDRFLSTFTGTTIGICYRNNISKILPLNEFDLPVDFVVCEK